MDYELFHGDRRLVRVVRWQDGATIPLDTECQDFCDFLSWASEQPQINTEPFPLRKEAQYFADKCRFIDYWKASRSLLSCNAFERDVYVAGGRRPLPAILRVSDAEAFFELCRAEAASREADRATSSGVVPTPSRVFVSQGLRKKLNEALDSEDDPVRRMSTIPIKRCFAYLDVSDFSKYTPGEEVLIINEIVRISEDPESAGIDGAAIEAQRTVEAKICIGDGYIFVLKRFAGRPRGDRPEVVDDPSAHTILGKSRREQVTDA